jgi:hypothetical protein
MPHNNPFTYGNPVPPDQLIGRDEELSNIVKRINTGQSTAMTGSLCSGKTSMLEYLRASEKQTELYADNSNQLIFYYLDASTLEPTYNKIQFWDEALKPLIDCINAPKTSSELSNLSDALKTCQEKQFGAYEFEKLIAQIRKVNWQLVLMIDEFDMLLHHPILNSTEFFGGLRSRVSLSKGALTLVIASNIPLSQLNEGTQHFSPTGFPYFNFMRDIILGPLPDAEINKLLQPGESYFTEEDHRFVKNIAGGHPYLLQVAASILWEMYDKGFETDSVKRQQRAKQTFYAQVVENTLQKMWQRWTEETQNELTSMVITYLEQQQSSLIQPIEINKLPEIKIEKRISEKQTLLLNELRRSGFVAQESSDGWQGFPNIFLDFARENQLRDSRERQRREESHVIVREDDDDMLEKLFTLKFLIFMFMGTIVGERLGYILTDKDFGVLSIFSGGEPLSVDIIKFCCAILGGFLGYKLVSKMTQRKNA